MIHKWFLGKYSAFLNIGKPNKDFYINNGVPNEKIFFTPYCIENERFSDSVNKLRSKRDDIRAEWKIEPSAFTFLFCAKFIEKKRPMDLLRAFNIAYKKIERSEKQIHLLMVGDGELKPQCEYLYKSSNLSVTFPGFYDLMKEINANIEKIEEK